MENRYPVPDGFRQLLEALAREVLRGQPKDIYAFSALFFSVLLDFRSELNGTNPLQKRDLYDKFKRRLFAAAIQESLVSPTILSAGPTGKAYPDARGADDADLMHQQPVASSHAESGASRGQDRRSSYQPGDEHDRNRAATKIQSNIRGYLTRKRYKAGTLKPAPRNRQPKRPVTLEDKAASKIQAGVRGFLTRKQLASAGYPVRSPTSRSPVSGEGSSPRSPLSNPDLAASKIQAGVRGYLTRKQLAARGVPVHSPTHYSHAKSHQKLDSPDAGADKAASKIQAGVRGYLTRKHLEHEGLRKSPVAYGNKNEMRRVTIANVDDAATKIQAGIRGYLTRKRLDAQGIKVRSGGATPSSCTSPSSPGGAAPGHFNHTADDGIESPGDAEEAAATKIQAAFRGHVARQQYMQGKHDDDFGSDQGEFM